MSRYHRRRNYFGVNIPFDDDRNYDKISIDPRTHIQKILTNIEYTLQTLKNTDRGTSHDFYYSMKLLCEYNQDIPLKDDVFLNLSVIYIAIVNEFAKLCDLKYKYGHAEIDTLIRKFNDFRYTILNEMNGHILKLDEMMSNANTQSIKKCLKAKQSILLDLYRALINNEKFDVDDDDDT